MIILQLHQQDLNNKKYNTNTIPGGYLYHRCHIIAWKLGGIDVDKKKHNDRDTKL